MVFLFSLTAALLYADQNLLAPNLTEAARFFGFNDKQRDELLGGAVMAAFFLVGAPAALLVSRPPLPHLTLPLSAVGSGVSLSAVATRTTP
jgi:hypothetical protein